MSSVAKRCFAAQLFAKRSFAKSCAREQLHCPLKGQCNCDRSDVRPFGPYVLTLAVQRSCTAHSEHTSAAFGSTCVRAPSHALLLRSKACSVALRSHCTLQLRCSVQCSLARFCGAPSGGTAKACSGCEALRASQQLSALRSSADATCDASHRISADSVEDVLPAGGKPLTAGISPSGDTNKQSFTSYLGRSPR